MNYQEEFEKIISKVSKRKTKPKLLLHSCCAPCSSYVLECLSKYFNVTIYYYNPNLDSKEEYDKRANELEKISKICSKTPIKIVVEEYNQTEYDEAIKGLEKLEEGSERCFKCYKFRMRKASEYAKKNKFAYFTTTLSVSPHKNSEKINTIGSALEEETKVNYLFADFKKKDGYKRSIELSHEYDLYRQKYCGCKYSKEESEKMDIFYNKGVTKDMTKFRFLGYFIKYIFIIAVLVIGFSIVIALLNPNERPQMKIPILPKEDTIADINELYVYGNHFNIKGEVALKEEVKKAEMFFISSTSNFSMNLNYDKKGNKLNFYIATELNGGFKLDDIAIGEYEMLLKLSSDDKERYYKLSNKTQYKNTEYYTVTSNEKINKIVFETENNEEMSLSVEATDGKKIYDIVIDPGHGGSDSGACKYGKCETDYTLDLSNTLKTKLEEAGFKVALTRTTDETLNKYGEDGRIARSYNTKAKVLISIHLNASSKVYHGFELYASNNIDYTFARNILEKLNSVNNFTWSKNTFNRMEPGLYVRTFSDKDVNTIYKESIRDKHEAYQISKSTNYYFMIRETGGYMTGAYMDGRDKKNINPYSNSNVGLESYIIELGYIISKNDMKYINEYKDEYLDAIAQAIIANY